MNAPAKLTAFAATLTVLFGGGALAGGAVGPERAPRPEAHDADAAGRGDGAHGGAKATNADTVAFMSTFPTAGAHRLFLQFKTEGAFRPRPSPRR